MAVQQLVAVRFKTGKTGDEQQEVEVIFRMRWAKPKASDTFILGEWWEEKKPASGFLGEYGRGEFSIDKDEAAFYDERQRPQDELKKAMDLWNFPLAQKGMTKGTRGKGRILRSKNILRNGACTWEMIRTAMGSTGGP